MREPHRHLARPPKNGPKKKVSKTGGLAVVGGEQKKRDGAMTIRFSEGKRKPFFAKKGVLVRAKKDRIQGSCLPPLPVGERGGGCGDE